MDPPCGGSGANSSMIILFDDESIVKRNSTRFWKSFGKTHYFGKWRFEGLEVWRFGGLKVWGRAGGSRFRATARGQDARPQGAPPPPRGRLPTGAAPAGKMPASPELTLTIDEH